MFALRLPLLALLAASAHGHLGLLGPKNVSQKDAEFEHLYVDEVNSELVNIYTFNHTVTRNRVSPRPPPPREPGDQPSSAAAAPRGPRTGLKLCRPRSPPALLPRMRSERSRPPCPATGTWQPRGVGAEGGAGWPRAGPETRGRRPGKGRGVSRRRRREGGREES